MYQSCRTQLHHWTVFAWTVVYNWQIGGIEGWAGHLYRMRCPAIELYQMSEKVVGNASSGGGDIPRCSSILYIWYTLGSCLTFRSESCPSCGTVSFVWHIKASLYSNRNRSTIIRIYSFILFQRFKCRHKQRIKFILEVEKWLPTKLQDRVWEPSIVRNFKTGMWSRSRRLGLETVSRPIEGLVSVSSRACRQTSRSRLGLGS